MKTRRITSLLALALVGACGGDAPEAAEAPASNRAAATQPAANELSATEMEQGIGPIRDMELGPVDAELAARGEEDFTTKCSACHKLDERYVGPALDHVLERRRPEFVMNMMLNASEMVQRHPVVRELLAEYFTPMTNQVTDPDEARAILEYLRTVQVDSTQSNQEED